MLIISNVYFSSAVVQAFSIAPYCFCIHVHHVLDNRKNISFLSMIITARCQWEVSFNFISSEFQCFLKILLPDCSVTLQQFYRNCISSITTVVSPLYVHDMLLWQSWLTTKKCLSFHSTAILSSPINIKESVWTASELGRWNLEKMQGFFSQGHCKLSVLRCLH